MSKLNSLKINIITCFITLLNSFNLIAQGDPNLKSYFPQVFFDKQASKEQLDIGNSTIKGVAFARENATSFNATRHLAQAGTIVTLFPFTPYIEEWYNLNLKHKGHYILMLPEAFSYRLETKTDEFGNFVFTKMKPGKYYIESIIDYTGTGKAYERVGQTDHYINGGYTGSTPIYQSYFYNYNTSQKVTKVVEITENNQLLEVKLKNGYFEKFKIGNTSSTPCYQKANMQYGSCKEFFSNGVLKIQADWDNHLLDGNYKEYNQTGQLIAEGNFKKNFKTDLWKYYKNGILDTEEEYKYKNNTSKLDGTTVNYYPNGKIKQKTTYENGLIEGSVIFYDTNGSIKQIDNYKNNLLNGESTTYYPSGKTKDKYLYLNGKIDKSTTMYNQDSTISNSKKNQQKSR